MEYNSGYHLFMIISPSIVGAFIFLAYRIGLRKGKKKGFILGYNTVYTEYKKDGEYYRGMIQYYVDLLKRNNIVEK